MVEDAGGPRKKQRVDQLRARLCMEKVEKSCKVKIVLFAFQSICYLALGDMKSCSDAIRWLFIVISNTWSPDLTLCVLIFLLNPFHKVCSLLVAQPSGKAGDKKN